MASSTPHTSLPSSHHLASAPTQHSGPPSSHTPVLTSPQHSTHTNSTSVSSHYPPPPAHYPPPTHSIPPGTHHPPPPSNHYPPSASTATSYSSHHSSSTSHYPHSKTNQNTSSASNCNQDSNPPLSGSHPSSKVYPSEVPSSAHSSFYPSHPTAYHPQYQGYSVPHSAHGAHTPQHIRPSQTMAHPSYQTHTSHSSSEQTVSSQPHHSNTHSPLESKDPHSTPQSKSMTSTSFPPHSVRPHGTQPSPSHAPYPTHQQATHPPYNVTPNDRPVYPPTTHHTVQSSGAFGATENSSGDTKPTSMVKKQPLKEWGQLRFPQTQVESHPKNSSQSSYPIPAKVRENQAQSYPQAEVKLEPLSQNNILQKTSGGSEPGKAALVEKLHKKIVKKEFVDEPKALEEEKTDKSSKAECEDDFDLKFEKLMDDLASHKDAITSKKSCILGRRYNQKVQLQNAVDNNEVIVPEPFPDEDDDMESEREEPIKKFRGKFRSIKDKAVERVILTYASHSDESATEMIPDEDASDFEEELIREIEAKARKGKGKGRGLKRDRARAIKSSGESEREKSSDHPSHRRGDKRKGKSDEDFTLSSSSYNDSSNSSSSSSQVSSSSEDDSDSSPPSSPSASSASSVNAARKSKKTLKKRRRGRAGSTSSSRSSSRSRSSSSSNSDDDFLPKRKTRRSKKISSDEDSFSASVVDLKAKRRGRKRKGKVTTRRKGRKGQKVEDSDEEGKKGSFKRRRRKRRKGEGAREDEDNTDTEENSSRRRRSTKRKKESLKIKLLKKKKRTVSSSDSEDERQLKNPQQRDPSKKLRGSEFDLKSKARKTKQTSALEESEAEAKADAVPSKQVKEEPIEPPTPEPEEDAVSLLDNAELLVRNDADSVLVKLKDAREEELSREDVLEMRSWRETATNEVMKLLEDLLETKWRHSWKKPTFGGDEFKKGWQGEVKRFKADVARIPRSLISTPPLPLSASPNQADTKAGALTPKKGKDGSVKKGKAKGSPAKNTRSKTGIIKTSMPVPENLQHKVAARPEISNVMERFFEKVLGSESLPLGPIKKFPAFAPFTPTSRSPTGLTPTPSLALSLMASDDSDRDSLASLRMDLPASDSVPVAPRRSSIANSLIKKLRKKYKDKKVDTQWLNKSRSLLETTNKPRLLPTPGLSTTEDADSKIPARYDQMRLTTFFRKDSVNRYRETFDDVTYKNGINEFTPVLVPSRTRKKTKAILDAATIKAVFGADPVPLATTTTTTPKQQLKALKEDKNKTQKKSSQSFLQQDLKRRELKEVLSGSVGGVIHSQSPNPSSMSSTPVDFLFNDDDDSEIRSERSEATLQELAIMQGIRKSRKKLRKFRKFRSGFDYIRKKKKAKTEEELLQTSKRRMPVRKRMLWPEESRDVANEVRGWVINKGLGETVLHKAARLQYHDVVTYCLESSDFNVNAKDNAGYTPLHEACNRGHLDIAQALCAHHAHVNASGYGGMRPLHEAIENGHIELARLLLGYGADPSLSTYGGQSCLALASDPQTERFVAEFLADLRGRRIESWFIPGPSKLFDLSEQGLDIFAETPTPTGVPAICPPQGKPEEPLPVESPASDPQPDCDSERDFPQITFECSSRLLPTVYLLTGREDRYVLLCDLLHCLSMSRMDLIMAAGSIETLHLSSEDYEKKLKNLVVGCQVSRKAPQPKGLVTLVKYSTQIEKLLDVEVTVIGDSNP